MRLTAAPDSIESGVFILTEIIDINYKLCYDEKPVYIDGKRHQTIDIYYNGVGMIEELTPDEFAEKFIQGKIKKPEMW